MPRSRPAPPGSEGDVVDRDRWRRLDEILDAALDRDDEERARFLDAACAGEPSLRREIEALIAADRKSGILDRDPRRLLGAAAPANGPSADGWIGERFGPYRVEREIGHGGMGLVFLASRVDDAFERQVAVKVLGPGAMSAAIEQRFRSERQILAALEHPSIARLYEGGTTPEGRPYLVMEYVDGMPIDEYCRERRLGVDQRLELFKKVCAAVHYAHQRLVVHRDLKPSNILVTADGEPKLLDFGIAKLLDPESFPATVEATVTGLRPMTPGYASPEQVRGEAITTASDVYSLGVLLYRLLTEKPPYRFESLSPSEIERVLREEAPRKPSAAVDRQAGPLRRRLAGDLDNIVLMALRLEPYRRYGSIQQLSDDLSRHLEGLPVTARQASFGYHLGKFLRRHKLAVAVAATILALVVAFAGAMAHQAAQISRQRDRAESERQRAETERLRAERVAEFLADLFKEADPWRRGAETITERQLLDLGAAKIERDLQDQPAVRASLLGVIGDVYGHLGLFDRAAPMVEQALAIQEDRAGPEHPEVASSLDRVAWLYSEQGRYDEAARLYERSLAIWKQLPGSHDLSVADSLRQLSRLARTQGRIPEAERLARQALELARRTLGPDAPEVAGFLRNLAGALGFHGAYGEAQELLEEALEIDLRVHGEVHTATGRELYNLGWIRFLRGEHAAALPFLERSLAIFEAVYQGDHPLIADSLLAIAVITKAQGHFGAAEDSLRRALALLEKALGVEHPRVANCRYELGDALLRQGRVAEAESQLRQSLALREKVFGADHPAVAESLGGLAEIARRHGDADNADHLFRRALAIWKSQPRHPLTRGIPATYAAFLRSAGRLREADELAARAHLEP